MVWMVCLFWNCLHQNWHETIQQINLRGVPLSGECMEKLKSFSLIGFGFEIVTTHRHEKGFAIYWNEKEKLSEIPVEIIESTRLVIMNGIGNEY